MKVSTWALLQDWIRSGISEDRLLRKKNEGEEGRRREGKKESFLPVEVSYASDSHLRFPSLEALFCSRKLGSLISNTEPSMPLQALD